MFGPNSPPHTAAGFPNRVTSTTCPVCHKPASTADLAAYRRCEDCWSDRFTYTTATGSIGKANVVTRPVALAARKAKKGGPKK